MIKIEQTEVLGWKHAIRGMRNPKNSWDRSDSGIKYCSDFEECDECPGLANDKTCSELDNGIFTVGENDHKLMMQLAAGGPVHAKYRRMIAVYVDITAPLYWWKEFDTYKVGTVANSCSTMHKIHDKQFTAEDFSCEHLMSDSSKLKTSQVPLLQDPNDYDNAFDPTNVFVLTMNMLNACRRKYLEVDERLKNDMSNEVRKGFLELRKKYWWQMIQLLPSSYNQKRTVMLNYEVLAGIYPMRKNHKLDEWHVFCEWIESLPYSELICGPEILRKKFNVPENSDKPVVGVDLAQGNDFSSVGGEVKENSEKGSEEVAETARDGKCTNCNGTGMVQIAPNIRGIKQCPVCHGTGKAGRGGDPNEKESRCINQ